MPMPKITNISANDAIKATQKLGYQITRQKGSHIILKNYDGRILIIPDHKTRKTGTALQIIKTMGISKEEFLGMI